MKKTLVFHGNIFRLGIESEGTGIYYTSLNLLEQFIKRDDLDVYIYYNGKNKAELKYFLDKKLNYNFKFCPSITLKDKIVGIFLIKRKQYKREKKFLRKIFCGIIKDFLNFVLYAPKPKTEHMEYGFSAFHLFDSNLVTVSKKYMLLHDTIPLVLGAYSKGISAWFEEIIHSINKDDFYFANSECTKQDFLRFFPQLKEEQITVTPLAAKKNFRQITDENFIAETRKKYRIPENKKYVFSLCTLEPRKNLLRAVKTFVEFVRKNKIEDMVFVLGGGAWKDFIVEFEKELGALPENLIYRAGYVEEEDLPALYSGAEWFVYTSQYEGFGLPPLEAMQCGCPVITSNNSSLPEVVGDAGIMIDYDSDEQHVNAYETYYYNEKLRKEMARKGLERSQLFSWEKTADLILTKMLG